MMILKIMILIVLTLMQYVLSFCGNTKIFSNPIETHVSPDSGLNLLIVADGQVLLKRTNWEQFHSTAFGAILNHGDLLQLTKESRAVVLCSGLTTWVVPGGAPSGVTNGCPPPPEPILTRDKSLISSTRGGIDPFIPYIISPRKTQLFSNKPTLRWNHVPDAAPYIVKVMDKNLYWKIKTNKTSVPYPGKPSLKRGVTYSLVVEADNGSSSEDEGIAGLGFSLLPEEKADRIKNAIARIEKLRLPNEAKAFALAKLYEGYDLIAEAIEILETLVESGNQSTAVYRTLGDLYWHSELVLLAERYYLRAVELAEKVGDIEGQAMVEEALGEVYLARGIINLSIKWLSKAQDGYKRLGDNQHVRDLEDRLIELNR